KNESKGPGSRTSTTVRLRVTVSRAMSSRPLFVKYTTRRLSESHCAAIAPALARAVPIAGALAILIPGALQLTAWKACHLACCREAPGGGRTLPADAAGCGDTARASPPLHPLARP